MEAWIIVEREFSGWVIRIYIPRPLPLHAYPLPYYFKALLKGA